jgi:hypothetical protein
MLEKEGPIPVNGHHIYYHGSIETLEIQTSFFGLTMMISYHTGVDSGRWISILQHFSG